RTPLTTRPAFTSRQGMMRLASTERLLQAEAALVERASDDRPVRPGLSKAPQVLERRDAAGGLDAKIRPAADEFAQEVEVRAGDRTVARDMGDQDVAHGAFRIEIERRVEAQARTFGPTMDGDPPALPRRLHVERQAQPLQAELGDPGLDLVGALHGGG